MVKDLSYIVCNVSPYIHYITFHSTKPTETDTDQTHTYIDKPPMRREN